MVPLSLLQATPPPVFPSVYISNLPPLFSPFHLSISRLSFAPLLSRDGANEFVRQNATHLLTNLTATHAEGMMAHFYGQVIPRQGAKA